MRQSIFVLLMMFATVGWLHAQTEAGNFLLGTSTTVGGELTTSLFCEGNPNSGGFFFGTTKDADDNNPYDDDYEVKNTNINLNPRLGYFVADGLLAGLNFNFSSRQMKEEDAEEDYEYKETFTGLSAGPFIRYYFTTSKIRPYVEGSASFGSIKAKYEETYIGDSYDDEETVNVTQFGGLAGVAFFVNDKVSVDIGAGYRSTMLKYEEYENFMGETIEDKDKTSSFGLVVGFSIFL